MAYLSRVARVVEQLSERGLDALLVTNSLNVRYLLNQPELAGGALLLSHDLQLSAVDRRERFPEKPTNAGFDEPEPMDLPSVRRVLSDAIGRIGFEDNLLTPADLEALKSFVPNGNEFIAAGGIVESVRELKEPSEVLRIQAAMQLTDQVLTDVASMSWVGRTERDIALAIDTKMLELGAEGPAFPTIVNAQPRSAMVHGVPTDAVLSEGDLVLVDVGARLDGYASDTTRMFALGAIDEELAAAYQLLLTAQEAGVNAIRAGVESNRVDAAARNLLVEAGYGEFFGHSLGHGVGIAIHEGPVLSPVANAPLLRANNVVTVEPGIYIPSKYGIRIEDLVAVTVDGCSILSSFPKDAPTVVQ